MAKKMRAAIFVEPGRIVLDEKPVPEVGPLDALIRVTTTTICGTDVHILKGEYPVAKGLTMGHEPVGVIEKLGSAVQGYREGDRVIAGAITPSGYSNACLCGCHSQDGPGTAHGWKAIGGWKFGNTIDGCQADYVLRARRHGQPRPGARRSRRRAGPDVPGHHVDRVRGAESGAVRIGDTRGRVRPGPDRAVRHGRGQADGCRPRSSASTRCRRGWRPPAGSGADHVVDFRAEDPVEAIMRLTDGRGVDVAIEALGTQATFEACLRVLRPGGTLSSLGVYSSDLTIPLGAVRRRPRRPQDRHHALPGRQGAHAPTDERDRGAAGSTCARWSRTASSSTRSRKPTTCSPTSATAC